MTGCYPVDNNQSFSARNLRPVTGRANIMTGVKVILFFALFLTSISFCAHASPLLKAVHLFDIKGEFSQPSDVAVSPNGMIYVMDGVNAKVKVFNPDGTFSFSFGKKGSGKGQFLFPLGIDIGESGNVYVADSGNHRLQILSAKGKFLNQAFLSSDTKKQPDPVDVAVDEKRNSCYVVDNDNHHIAAFSLSPLKQLKVFGSPGELKQQFRYPFLIDLDSEGYLYIVDVINTRVQVLTPKGLFVIKIGGWGVDAGTFFRPKGIAVDPNNLVYVSDSYLGVIQVFTTSGNLHAIIADSETAKVKKFVSPVGLHVDKKNRLYVVEMFANKVGVYSLGSVEKSK